MVQFDFPESMDDLLYFTNRKLPDGTKILAYVERPTCTQCNTGVMGKPRNEKTGKIKIRSPIFICSNCGYEQKKEETLDLCEVTIQYTNPEATEVKTTSAPYKRKTWKGMKAIVFHNEFLGEKTGITNRMKTKQD